MKRTFFALFALSLAAMSLTINGASANCPPGKRHYCTQGGCSCV